MTARRLAALCVALVAFPVLLLAAGASAATHVVTLSADGPSPSSITISRGDTVTFRNADDVQHTVRRTSGAWSFEATVPPGGSARTPVFASTGSYGYEDSYAVALLTQRNSGSIAVTEPRPTTTRTASPRPSPTATATRTPTASPTAGPSASPSPSGTGVAVGPGIGVTTIPPISPTQGPTPNIAPPPVTASETAPVSSVAYGDKAALVQSSPHRYGLPMALALVLAIGVLSLIVRLLLAVELR